MNCYLLRPKVPLLFRSGRPFGLRAETLPFPPPSAVAGALRGILFESRQEFKQLDRLDKVAIDGPLLVRRLLDGSRVDILFPKPADAVYSHGKDDSTLLHSLCPQAIDINTEGMDLPKINTEGMGDLPDAGLWPLFLQSTFDGKPCGGPAFWQFDALVAWLDGTSRANPKQQYNKQELPGLGIKALPVDRRAHVAVKPDSLTSVEGALFESNRLDFGPRWDEKANAWDDSEYGLLVQSSETLPEGFFTLGGKGGLTYLEPQTNPWPTCPDSLAQALADTHGLRLVLATHGYFEQGWRPGWLIKRVNGHWQGSPPGFEDRLVLRLRAVALERWQPHSGWDVLAFNLTHPSRQGKPITPVRRLAPAGSVYWFSIEKGGADDVAGLWLRSICDDPRARRDGFGLALPGVWQDPTCEFTGKTQ